jgi:hypothetical protein
MKMVLVNNRLFLPIKYLINLGFIPIQKEEATVKRRLRKNLFNPVERPENQLPPHKNR